MGLKCGRADCTLAETGACLLNNDPESCPELVWLAQGFDGESPEKEHFPPSRACALSGARSLMRRSYTQIVGILGEPAAGKTACLVGLYLLLGRNRLKGYHFANSTTLRGFEEISRGARRWDRTHPPEELTQHTELTADRLASFLHLRLARSTGRRNPVDVLLSDLPGEWTSELVSHGRVDRLAFLRRADAIWLVMDGDKLRQPESRQLARHRMELVVARLGTFLSDTKPPAIFVVTRRDQGALEQERLATLQAAGRQAGFESYVVEVACFADGEGDVQPGHGLSDLMGKTIECCERTPLVRREQVVDDTFALPEIGLTRKA